jgi:hypothetical protein
LPERSCSGELHHFCQGLQSGITKQAYAPNNHQSTQHQIMEARKIQKNPYVTKNQDFDHSSQGEDQPLSEELKTLLPKLRPFQKEAFLFATQGTVSKRLRQTSSSNSKGDDPEFTCDPSLLGKGRILLGDEMGLGSVYLFV